MAGKPVPLITEEIFREAYGYEEVKKPSFKVTLKNTLKCSKSKFFLVFPFARWISEYNARKDILHDAIAGVTVAVMHVPHGLAYAPLGRVDPVVGFYMAVFPVLVYFFLGTSRHISIGTFAVICAMVGEIVQTHTLPGVFPDTADLPINITNRNRYTNIEVGVAMSLMVGFWQTGLGLLQLGTFSVILSESLVSGYTAGAAVHVFSYQLRNLFGLNMRRFVGAFKLYHIYVEFFQRISDTNLVSLSISIICISILLFFNEYVKVVLDKRFPNNKFPVPIELIVIGAGILFSYVLHLEKNYDVKVVSHIPTGFPKLLLPPTGLFEDLLQESLVVAIVSLAINISLARIFAKKGNYKVSSNHEFFAYGMANIFSAFFQCLPSSASLSRSSIQFKAGGRSQVASIFSVAIIILILLFAGPIFEPVPYCVLSSIVVVTLKGLLMQIIDFPRIWRESVWNGAVWGGTFLAVVILDLDLGLVVGLTLSLISVIFSAYSHQIMVMGRVPDTSVYLSIEHFSMSQEVPNILILKIFGNFNFTNSNRLELGVINRFETALVENTTKPKALILDMSAVSRVDPMAVNVIKDLYKYLQKRDCDLYLTECNLLVYKSLEVCRLFLEMPRDCVLATVNDAVQYLSQRATP